MDAATQTSRLDPAKMAAMSGLELLRAMARGELPGPPIAQTLDFTLAEAEQIGRAHV